MKDHSRMHSSQRRSRGPAAERDPQSAGARAQPGPRTAAQRALVNGLFGAAAQRVGPEEEMPLQGRFETAQRAGPEEELMQGRFETAQRAGPEEELMQGRFETAQRAGPEEELLQGRFEAAQRVEEEEPLQGRFATAQAKAEDNRTGMPDALKAGIESLSGMDMSGVRVHTNSPQPAQLNALAYAQGNDIHLAPGQDSHLPHEAWHVVQQRQGRVQPTLDVGGKPVNDNPGLEHEADVMGAKALQRARAPR